MSEPQAPDQRRRGRVAGPPLWLCPLRSAVSPSRSPRGSPLRRWGCGEWPTGAPPARSSRRICPVTSLSRTRPHHDQGRHDQRPRRRRMAVDRATRAGARRLLQLRPAGEPRRRRTGLRADHRQAHGRGALIREGQRGYTVSEPAGQGRPDGLLASRAEPGELGAPLRGRRPVLVWSERRPHRRPRRVQRRDSSVNRDRAIQRPYPPRGDRAGRAAPPRHALRPGRGPPPPLRRGHPRPPQRRTELAGTRRAASSMTQQTA